MEVRKGYKQTEVGVIPEDWDIQPLGTLTDPKRPISYGIVQTGPNIQNGVKCLRVLDIENGRINKANLITTTEAISTSYKRTILKAGDLVTPLRGKVGEVALVDEDLAGSNLTRGVALIALQSNLSARFFKQFISSPVTRGRLEQSMNGSALQEVPIATFRAFKVAFPTRIAEQGAIAEALSDADALIEAVEQLLAKKRQVKQSAMSELLTGKRRLSGFSGKSNDKPLADICKIEKGEQLNRDTLSLTDDYPVWNGGIEPSGYTNHWNTEANMITVSEGGNSCGFVNFLHQRFWRGGHCYALKNVDSGISQKYLYQYLKHREKDIMALRVGSGLPNIQRARLSGFEVYIPPLEEQIAIAEILSDMDAEISALEEKLVKARQVKAGMMSELLTGKLRLV